MNDTDGTDCVGRTDADATDTRTRVAARARGRGVGPGLLVLALGVATAAGAGACGGDDDPGGGGTLMPVDSSADPTSYFPLGQDATWTYNIVRQGIPKTKTMTVEGGEVLPSPKAGVTAVRVREESDGEVQLTWFERQGSTVIIHRQSEFNATGAEKWDEWYVPSDSRIEESADKMQVGGTWTVEYDVVRSSAKKGESTKHKVHQFDVEAVGEEVTVPAGTFTAVRIRRSDPVDGSYRQYWYVQGTGKVRELEDNGDSEELASFGGGAVP